MRKAKWEVDNTKETTFKCSNCKKEPLYKPDQMTKKAYPILTNYCAFCGRKMREEI